MAIRWRIAILLAVITTINYIDRSVFGVVAPVVPRNATKDSRLVSSLLAARRIERSTLSIAPI